MKFFYRITLLLVITAFSNTQSMGSGSIEEMGVDNSGLFKWPFAPVEVLVLNWEDFGNQDPSLSLNGQVISNTGEGLYSFDTDVLVSGENVLEAVPNFGYLDGITTLDLVMLYRGLIALDGLDPVMAIAADIDKSGSVSTIDLFGIRKSILGIETANNLGQPFLLRSTIDITELDMFDFNNVFNEYRFENTELQGVSKLEFEVFQYGNLSQAKSDNHKSNEFSSKANLSLSDQAISTGEIFDVTLILNHQDLGAISGAGWKMLHPNLDLLNVSISGGTSELLWNDKFENETTFSYLPQTSQKEFTVRLQFRALRDGQLSTLISLDETFKNEQISEVLNVHPLELNFSKLELDAEHVAVYPNPVSEQLFIENVKGISGYDVLVYNALGKLILSDRLDDEILELDRGLFNTEQILFIHISNEDHYIIEKVFFK